MAMRSKWTESNVSRKLKRWLRKFEHVWGSTYESWLNVRSFSSRGFTSQMASRKFGRSFVFFSYAERGVFVILESRSDVVALREQSPLDPKETREIAAQMGIAHPCYPGTHTRMVMTCDFLVKVRTRSGEIVAAIDVKDDTKAMSWRTTEKLAITRAYYARRGIRHVIVFRKDIPDALVNNLEWIRMAEPRAGERLVSVTQLDELAAAMADELSSTYFDSRPLSGLCEDFDTRHGQRPGTGLRVARILIARRALTADLASPSLAQQPLSNFALSTQWAALIGQRNV